MTKPTTQLNLLARGGLLAPDVAALFTREAEEIEAAKARAEGRDPRPVKPVSERTVLSFIDFSQPRGRSLPEGTALPNPEQRNRYETDPMPLPVLIRSRIHVWVPDPDNPAETLEHVRQALKLWYHERFKR